MMIIDTDILTTEFFKYKWPDVKLEGSWTCGPCNKEA